MLWIQTWTCLQHGIISTAGQATLLAEGMQIQSIGRPGCSCCGRLALSVPGMHASLSHHAQLSANLPQHSPFKFDACGHMWTHPHLCKHVPTRHRRPLSAPVKMLRQQGLCILAPQAGDAPFGVGITCCNPKIWRWLGRAVSECPFLHLLMGTPLSCTQTGTMSEWQDAGGGPLLRTTGKRFQYPAKDVHQ